MPRDYDEQFFKRIGGKRIVARQNDELLGVARGLIADGVLSQGEVEFLQKWLAANTQIVDNPVIKILFERINDILDDGAADADECAELLETLKAFGGDAGELGEALRATTLPLCDPAPDLTFTERRYCFTGTFVFGKRRDCEDAVKRRGAAAGSLTQRTDILVVGSYATESWKHSAFGNKIIQACEWRDRGIPIAIVSEKHWQGFLA